MGCDLITLDDFKQAKGLTNSNDDTRLSLIISSVSQLVKTYCGNSFVDYVSSDKVEYFTIEHDYSKIMPTEISLISVTSVSEREDPSSSYKTLVENEDYVISFSTDTVWRLKEFWKKGIESVKIEYKAGYSTIPLDLKLAVIDLVMYYFKEEYTPSRSMSGSSMELKTTSSLDDNIGFPDHIKRVLDLYKQL